MPTPDARPSLVVNADDFGYFPEVSLGIAECAIRGIVTATSIIVNAETGTREIDELRALEYLDHGIHLNLSHGSPLTPELGAALEGGHFPAKFSLLRQLCFGAVSVELIDAEWRAQVKRIADAGVHLDFMNCHEHLHMFPGLFKRFVRIATDFQIPFIRFCTPEWTGPGTAGRLLRNTLFTLTASAASKPTSPRSARLLGVGPSGALSRQYLEHVLPTLQPGRLYELMCHPGHGNPSGSGALSDYHAWDAERELLCSPSTRELIESHGIELTRFTTAAH